MLKHPPARRLFIAVLTTATITTVVACGGAPSQSNAATSNGAVTKDGTFAQPVKLGFLWETKGESAVAIDDYQRGAMLAVKHINHNGGIGGHPLKTFRVSTPPLNLQKTDSAFLRAADKNPTALIGLVSPSQVRAVVGLSKRAQIPVLATTSAETDLAFGKDSGSKYISLVGASNPEAVRLGINYLVQKKGAKHIGLMASNNAFGSSGLQVAKQTLAKHHLKPYAVAQYNQDARDLTQQVLRMKGADAVLDWGYPAPMAVQLKQFHNYGLNIPSMLGVGVETAIAGGSVPKDTRNGLYVAEPCNPRAPANHAMETFVKHYRGTYGNIPSQNAAYSYDAVRLIAAAAKNAGSAKAEKVNAALEHTKLPNGACGPLNQDGAHFLSHTVQITKYYSSSKQPKVVEVRHFDPLPKQN
jgi:ABC-type branched-subunit amino acid transport system substrate-binding protein